MLSGRLHDSGIDKFRLIRGIGTADIETSDAEFCRGLIGRISGCGKPIAFSSSPIPARGCWRFRWMSLLRAFRGET